MRCARAWPASAAKWWMLKDAMVIERYTLNQWLQAKREQFVTYSIEEIAELAITCGFTKEDVDHSILKQDRRFL